MSILSDFEDRMARAVEGVFAGVFRSPVQPAELARAAAKEMDRRKVLGVGKVFAPTLYNVLLSPEDDRQLGGFASTLGGELETYLVGYARERGYSLATRPVVRFLVDDELRLGRFDVIGELLSPEEIAEELGDEYAPPAPAAPGMPRGQVAVPEGTLPRIATVTVRGVEHDVVLQGARMVVGRLTGCDVCLGDVNASREHAAFIAEGTGWALEDLGSTNGTLVNGEPITRVRLRDGDVVTIGISELVYHEPKE